VVIVSEAHSFGRYRVTGTLGAGGMGEVYAAVDEVLGREVAVKTLRGKHSGLAARMLDDRFRQEARAIASLAHPGVVQVFDIDLAAEPPYIVMERVAGPTLKERLEAGPLAASELRALGIQIARALAAAQAVGIVHRDVKPANILAAGAGMWKLADFGVAHVPDSAITMTGQFVGSPAYAPPEALMRGQTGPEGDIYGLGACLYEAAAGRWPRREATSGALFAPVPPLHDHAPALPADLLAVIDRAVAIEPHDRPTAAELADALAGAVSTPGMAIAPIGMPAGAVSVTSAVSLPGAPRPSSPFRWQRLAVAGAAVIVVIVIILGATSQHGSTAATPLLGPPAPGLRAASDPAQPRAITARPPQGMDGRAAKDWNRIVDKLYQHRFAEAHRKLVEFEQKYRETPETTDLREQLEALPAATED
jgi:serine/threonine-protein kinase